MEREEIPLIENKTSLLKWVFIAHFFIFYPFLIFTFLVMRRTSSNTNGPAPRRPRTPAGQANGGSQPAQPGGQAEQAAQPPATGNLEVCFSGKK